MGMKKPTPKYKKVTDVPIGFDPPHQITFKSTGEVLQYQRIQSMTSKSGKQVVYREPRYWYRYTSQGMKFESEVPLKKDDIQHLIRHDLVWVEDQKKTQ
jgi:hypothetical protein